jgi:ATP-dependent Clp protease protease subunit
MQVVATKEQAAGRVLDDMRYPLDPLVDGTLYVSDRRISLNGPIITGTADWVTSRLHYFNNQSREKPIFIVIDSCPGGSVMQGYRIVKAMEESDAPVHVLVKSYAASMAAVITTLADHSYAYPNAIILHHQMSSGMRGNLTQQQEQLEKGFEWARRLADPVAEKMGVSYERMVEMMYENNSDGDWDEFADEAVKLNWVNAVVHEVREQGIREQPNDPAPSFFFFWMTNPDEANPAVANIQRDERGNPFIQLPPLQPFDHYAIHNPDNFYRW